MKKNSSIRVLEAKAKKGDVNASFQLAEYYSQGQYVDRDIDKATLYYENALKNFNPKIHISFLRLINFRRFTEIEVDFSKSTNLILFLGINGAGKTTILDAIAKCMSWLIILLTRQGGKGDIIELGDINNSSEFDYASIISRFSVSANEYGLELSKAREGSNRKRSGQYEEIRQLAELYKLANSKNDQFNFPIMAFYSVKRAVDK